MTRRFLIKMIPLNETSGASCMWLSGWTTAYGKRWPLGQLTRHRAIEVDKCDADYATSLQFTFYRAEALPI